MEHAAPFVEQGPDAATVTVELLAFWLKVMIPIAIAAWVLNGVFWCIRKVIG